MSQYFENLNGTLKEYFKVLSDEIPDFLYDYIDTPEMQRIGKIGCGCGTDYTNIFHNKFFYSNLDHSIGVALIVWNFTRDKKLLTKKDLYTLSEQEVIEKIENCEDETISKCFKLFRNSTDIFESDEPVLDKYCISINAKKRYIIPLVDTNDSYERINNISISAKEQIDNYLQSKTKKYAYLDFNF